VKSDEVDAISAKAVLIECALKQCRRQESLHPLKPFLLAWVWPPGPSIQIEGHGTMKQTNRFEIEIELESWS